MSQTVEKLEDYNYLNENLLDELQMKIFNLMEAKYYPSFKHYSEFHKLLIKNSFYLNFMSEIETLDEDLNSQDEDSIIFIHKPEKIPSNLLQSSNQNLNKFKLQAVITSSGRCNDLKSTYAIYIIDVTKGLNDGTTKNEYWQTYRRFNVIYYIFYRINLSYNFYF